MKNLQENQKILATRLGCSLDDLIIEEPTERIYISDAKRFNELLQKRRITQLNTGGGYHFVLPIKNSRSTKYWKITLAEKEREEFDREYAHIYEMRRSKSLRWSIY